MCHWKNHQSSNYHVSMLSGKRCETSKCVNTDYFISTSYQLYCEHQCLNVYSAAGWLLQANTITWHPELSNPWWNHVCFLQKWAAKQILDISRRSDSTGIKPEDREGNKEPERTVPHRCGSDFQVQSGVDREQRRRSWSPFPQRGRSSREQNTLKLFLIVGPETSCDFNSQFCQTKSNLLQYSHDPFTVTCPKLKWDW